MPRPPLRTSEIFRETVVGLARGLEVVDVAARQVLEIAGGGVGLQDLVEEAEGFVGFF
jgi:hypothetical protein